MVHRVLALDLYYPARVIFGYNGFKSEEALRDSFAGYLGRQVARGGSKAGFGAFSLPSLICCGPHSLLKANGMPFAAPMDEEGYWPIYVSTSGNPLELLLEVVWTRLVYGGKLPASLFDDGSLIHAVNRFIDARPAKGGWEYRFMPLSKKESGESTVLPGWEPWTLDVVQWTVVERLCQLGRIDTKEPDLVKLLANHGYSLDDFVASLRKMGLAALDGTDLVLLTRRCQCAILPDGRYVAGENCAGQLTRWFDRYLDGRGPTANSAGKTSACDTTKV